MRAPHSRTLVALCLAASAVSAPMLATVQTSVSQAVVATSDNPTGAPGTTIQVTNNRADDYGTTYASNGGSYFSVDANTGNMSFSVPSTANIGDYWTRYMTTTYPDGTTSVTKMVFTTANAPKATGAPGTTVTIDNANQGPSGTSYASSGGSYFSVDPTTGAMKFAFPSTANPGDYWTRYMTTTFADGFSFTTKAVFTAGQASSPVVDPNADTDGDGLLDDWEVNGYDANGDGIVDVDFPAMGANPNHKDLYVEMDQMDNLMASATELDAIVATFAGYPLSNPDGVKGITLHLDAGSARGAKYDLGGGGDVLARRNLTNGLSDVVNLRSQYSDAARNNVFHYMIWADSYGTSSSSGVAQINGRTFMTSVGPTYWGSASSTIREATFIHELGHNLGLRHGGTDDVNYKPNYLSIMNYRYQLSGVKHTDGSLYLGYSTRTYPSLNEGSLSEATALGSAGAGWMWAWGPAGKFPLQAADQPADYDRDGSIETTSSADLNADGMLSTLTAPNDMATMHFQVVNPAMGVERSAPEVESNELTADEARKNGWIS